jgi:hypothetical protein
MTTQEQLQKTARELCQKITRTESSFGPLVYLKEIVTDRWVTNFSVKVADEIPELRNAPDANGTFYFNRFEAKLTISNQFFRQWSNLEDRLGAAFKDSETDCVKDLRISEVFEMFLLHEFAHMEQNLTADRHADIRQAQNVLRSVDYYADMLAVLIAIRLDEKNWDDEVFSEDKRECLGRKSYAALLAARVFNPFDVTQLRLTPNRVRRIFALYLQHFRSTLGNWTNAAQMQLLYEPAIDFRNVMASNMQGHAELHRDSFRNLMAQNHGTTLLWITFPARFLTPRVIRVKDGESYAGHIPGNIADLVFDTANLSDNYNQAKNLFYFIKSSGEGAALFEKTHADNLMVKFAK